MPIRIRLALILALGTAVAFALGGWLFVSVLSDNLRHSLLTDLHAQADAVSQQLQEHAPGPGTATSGGVDLSDSQDVTQVLDVHGQVLASSGLASSSSVLSPLEAARAQHGAIVLERAATATKSASLVVAQRASDGRPFLVAVEGSLASVDSAVSRATLEIVLGGIISVLAAAAAGWMIAGAALTPVERMRRNAAAISDLNQNTMLDVPVTRDEIAALAETLNDLLSRLHDSLERHRSFVAAAGHELRSPLANLKMELELAARPGRSREELAAAVGEAATETDRLIHLAEDLLLLAESDEGTDFVHLEGVDLTELGTLVVDASTPRAARRAISLTLDSPPSLIARADPIRLRQALDNLIDNALRFAPAGSTVTLTIRQHGQTAELSVLDQGPGFEAQFMPRAFDRFSRSESTGVHDQSNTGLGLSIVEAIAHAHSGDAVITSAPGRGACVVIRIPIDCRRPELG